MLFNVNETHVKYVNVIFRFNLTRQHFDMFYYDVREPFKGVDGILILKKSFVGLLGYKRSTEEKTSLYDNPNITEGEFKQLFQFFRVVTLSAYSDLYGLMFGVS